MEKVVPRVCSFRGAREEVMERVWRKASELEARGIPLTHELFGQMIKEEWKKVKEEAKRVCPVVSIEEIRKILREFKTETVEKSVVESEEEARKPVKVRVGAEIETQKTEE